MRKRVIPFLAPALALLLAACAPQGGSDAGAPDRPFDAGAFRLAADPRVLAGRETGIALTKSGALTLPELIDIAQTNNPATSAAWLSARQAAQAEGLVETTCLPRICANILAGTAATSTYGYQDPARLLPDGTLSLGTDNAVAAVAAYWLLFDVGKRAAARGEARELSFEAKELSFAAEVGFSGAHQTLIHNVPQAYHDLHAATRREAVHARQLANAGALAAATRAKRAQGLSTVTDLAGADQAVAQARFDLARASSETRVIETRLSAHLGLPAGQPVRVAFPAQIELPRTVPDRLDAHIDRAFARRPDLQAAFSRARAGEAHVTAFEAEFRPRIYAAAALGHSTGSVTLGDSRIPGDLTLGDDGRPVASVFVGVTIPLWDAGARARRLGVAQDQQAATLAEAESLRLLAETKIVGACELLQCSLEANAAAGQLVSATRVSYDAAVSFAERGLASVAEVSLAQQLLFDAESARIEAQHAALSAVATLASASGQLG